jgi:hypothetical protein
MYHSGIGGGGFMLVRDANGSYVFVDFQRRLRLPLMKTCTRTISTRHYTEGLLGRIYKLVLPLTCLI